MEVPSLFLHCRQVCSFLFRHWNCRIHIIYRCLCVPFLHHAIEFENSVGKIVRVSLVNFLNHGNLVVNCSPHLNMIFGMNGQGKSAIVQGLALCFGGYGHSVGRDTNLCHYIKDYHLRDGPNSARIEVLLSNHGEGSYMPEEYGDIIMLCRTIPKGKSSSSSFSMGGTLVKKKPVKKKDVLRYLRHVKMNSNPSNIYRYYTAAAGLIEMEENISTEKKNLEDCKAELKIRKRVLGPDREKLKDLAKQICLFEEKLNEWKSAKKMYKLSLYKADKEHYESLRDTYESYSKSDPKEEITKLKDSIQLYNTEYSDMKADVDNLTTKTFTLKESIASIIDRISAMDDSINDARSRVSAKQTSISHIETAMEKLSEELAAAASEPADAEKNRLERELAMCHKEYDEVHRQHHTTTVAISHIESTISEIEMQLRDVKAELDDQKRENAAMDATSAPRTSTDPCRRSLYRYDVDLVRQEIQKMRSHGLFSHVPIGPIGDYLVVTQDVPNWKILGVIEHHLRNVLHTWLVATERDRRALEDILLKHGCSGNHTTMIKTNVFTRPDLVDRMKRQLSHTSHRSAIYSYLAVREIPPLLLYVLADSCGIGRALICTDDQELYAVLNDKSINVGVAYSLTNLNSGRRLNGSLHMSPCYERNPFSYAYVRFSSSSACDASWELQERKNSGLEREVSLTKMLSELTKELHECTLRLNASRSKLDRIRMEKTSVIRKRIRLEADLQEELDNLISTNHSSSYNKYCESLEGIKSDYRKQLKELGGELLELEAEVGSLESQKAELESQQSSTNDELKSVIKDVSARKTDMQKVQQRIQTQKVQIKTLEKNIKEFHFKLEGCAKEMEESKEKIKAHEAEMDSEGIDYSVELPAKPPEAYLKILNLSNEVLQKIVDDSRNIESHLLVLREKHAAAERALEEKEHRLKETTDNYRTQKQNYIKRCTRFEECRARMERKAKRAFRQTLDAVTGYDGNLVFNDVDRTLDIQIHNKQQSYSRVHVATDLKTLSGGEQSSIQLSMLQSLASISFSPIHMFDEVDVYMDESVRVKNIESLVRFAANNPRRQFFLVTPHSELANHIKELHPDITKIFRVARDP
ncbi:hypothetical protein X943_001738 [Babesia divergens]|uniref:RecF/RecN/SMC N-terminal domain-containing protein n=1 Tax=Babesia divergens TaxID=32595 RepID=A0AAD9GFH5_BABDI|nr:hypothetical protein X943_001738 [Babesia divergens]